MYMVYCIYAQRLLQGPFDPTAGSWGPAAAQAVVGFAADNPDDFGILLLNTCLCYMI